MSELKVNKISPETGTAITLGDSGDTFTVPSGCTITNSGTATGFGGGKVLQFVHTVKTDSYTTSTAGSWVDVTGLTVTTGALASTGSKVLVQVTMNVGSTADYASARIVDGSGGIITGFVGDAASGRTRGSFGVFYRAADGGGTIQMNLAANLYDSPSSTSAQTYKVQTWSGGALYVNRGASDTDNTSNNRSVSAISAMEIGA